MKTTQKPKDTKAQEKKLEITPKSKYIDLSEDGSTSKTFEDRQTIEVFQMPSGGKRGKIREHKPNQDNMKRKQMNKDREDKKNAEKLNSMEGKLKLKFETNKDISKKDDSEKDISHRIQPDIADEKIDEASEELKGELVKQDMEKIDETVRNEQELEQEETGEVAQQPAETVDKEKQDIQEVKEKVDYAVEQNEVPSEIVGEIKDINQTQKLNENIIQENTQLSKKEDVSQQQVNEEKVPVVEPEKERDYTKELADEAKEDTDNLNMADEEPNKVIDTNRNESEQSEEKKEPKVEPELVTKEPKVIPKKNKLAPKELEELPEKSESVLIKTEERKKISTKSPKSSILPNKSPKDLSPKSLPTLDQQSHIKKANSSTSPQKASSSKEPLQKSPIKSPKKSNSYAEEVKSAQFQGIASTPTDSSVNTITFVILYPTHFGEVVYILGSHERFGSWEPEKAVPLKWNIGNIWTVTMEKKYLPKRSQFKFIIKGDDGTVQWEDRPNRAFDLNIIHYALRTSKNFDSQGYTLIDQRTTKLEFYSAKKNVVLTHKWGI
jgi:hypothetical protein